MLIAALRKIHKRWNCVLSNQLFVVHGKRGQFCKFAMSRQATFSISGSLTESKLCLGTAASANLTIGYDVVKLKTLVAYVFPMMQRGRTVQNG